MDSNLPRKTTREFEKGEQRGNNKIVERNNKQLIEKSKLLIISKD